MTMAKKVGQIEYSPDLKAKDGKKGVCTRIALSCGSVV